MRSVVVIGGRGIEEQSFIARRGAELLIGTPGRIEEGLKTKYLALNQCNWVVLDEADKMIELGFESSVNYILDSIPASNMKSEDENLAELQEKISASGEKIYRVTHMFSATMPVAVEKLARKF